MAAPGTLPSGIGVFARGQSAAWLSQWDFVALNASRSDVRTKAAHLRARTIPFWLYSTPEKWLPAAYVAEIARLESLVETTRAAGIIADPENGWPDIDSGARAVLAGDLGRRLRDMSARMSVGVSSYPLFPGRRALAESVGDSVFGVPQLYMKGRPPSALAGWNAEWTRLFGVSIPGVSGWVSDPAIQDLDGFINYLNSVPPSRAAIAWTTSEGPRWMMTALRQWEPQGTLLDRGGLVLDDALRVDWQNGNGRTVALGTIFALLFVGAAAAFYMWKGR